MLKASLDSYGVRIVIPFVGYKHLVPTGPQILYAVVETYFTRYSTLGLPR